MNRFIRNGLAVLLSGVFLSMGVACQKESPDKGSLIVDHFETKRPITAFYPVAQVIASKPYKSTRDPIYSWELHVPAGSVSYSASSQPEKYQSLYKEYGIAETTYTSHAPIREVFFATGMRSLRLVFEGATDHQRVDLTERATLGYEEYLRRELSSPLTTGRSRVFPGRWQMEYRQVPLVSLTEVDLRWVFWWFQEKVDYVYPVVLSLRTSDLDLTQGRLLLIVEREGDTPLEVELPQS